MSDKATVELGKMMMAHKAESSQWINDFSALTTLQYNRQPALLYG